MSVTEQTAGGVDARPGWHGVDVVAVAQQLGVDPTGGLSVGEAGCRLQAQGRNRLVEARKESGLQAFVRQYRDFMQLILLAVAVINLLVTGDAGTQVVAP